MKKYIVAGIGFGVVLTVVVIKNCKDVIDLTSAVNDLYNLVEQQQFDKGFEDIIENL